MKIGHLALILIFSLTVFASDSPDTREITDPKSLSSLAEPGAAPVPIDDLFYTRSVDGGAWSPDGKEIVFTTNLTGRLQSLESKRRRSAGPSSSANPTTDNTAARGRLTENGSCLRSDKGGGEIYDLFAIPATAAKSST